MINNDQQPFEITDSNFKKFSDDGCLICYETNFFYTENGIFTEREVTKVDIIKTSCEHLFHISCMLKYMKANNYNINCPLCRREIQHSISYIKSIEIKYSIKELATSNDPQGIRNLIYKNPTINVDIQTLNLGLKRSLTGNDIEKVVLWLELGANDYELVKQKLKDSLTNNLEQFNQYLQDDRQEKLVLLIDIGLKLNDPTVSKLLMLFFADQNDFGLFEMCVKKLIPNTSIARKNYQLILQRGMKAVAYQNSTSDAEEWISFGAELTTEIVNIALNAAMEKEDVAGFNNWLWLANLHRIKKLNTVTIANIGLQQSADNNKPYLGKKWINLGATGDINIFNKGLIVAEKLKDLQSAKEWIILGADKNIISINEDYTSANPNSKIFWQELGINPTANQLNIELKQALENDNFIGVMDLLKKQKVVPNTENLSLMKAKINKDSHWKKLLSKYTKIVYIPQK